MPKQGKGTVSAPELSLRSIGKRKSKKIAKEVKEVKEEEEKKHKEESPELVKFLAQKESKH